MDANSRVPHRPRPQSGGAVTLGLFHKQVAGDDSLLELARQRFQQAGMGAEMHAHSPAELERRLQFRPAAETPVVVHLPRDLHLLEAESRGRVLDFASRFAGRIAGLVVHDEHALADRQTEWRQAAGELEARLAQIEHSPFLFLEYAAGLEPAVFLGLLAPLSNLPHISACLDIGHVGIWQTRQSYAQVHPGEDVCALRENPARLPAVLADVEQAVTSALPTVLRLIESLGRFAKPVHFHLHDGHPLSTASPYGVSDHLDFLGQLPVAWEGQLRCLLPLMFGPAGLFRIVAQALAALGAERASFTLEIHPTHERLPLGDAAPLFAHWRDLTHAEVMNHWLAVLVRNHQLLREAIAAA